MFLELSDGDFARILKLAYLGEVVMNDWTPIEEWNDEQREMSDFLLVLQSKAADSPVSEMVEQDVRTGQWMPSASMREELEPLINQYDDEAFWDELVHRLARRDLIREYGAEALSTMTEAHIAEAERSMIDYYNKEVDDHGLDRFMIAEDTKGSSQS
jgi:hypothetical protein